MGTTNNRTVRLMALYAELANTLPEGYAKKFALGRWLNLSTRGL